VHQVGSGIQTCMLQCQNTITSFDLHFWLKIKSMHSAGTNEDMDKGGVWRHVEKRRDVQVCLHFWFRELDEIHFFHLWFLSFIHTFKYCNCNCYTFCKKSKVDRLAKMFKKLFRQKTWQKWALLWTSHCNNV